MVNLFTKCIPAHVAEKYYTIEKLTSKLQGTANIVFFYNPYLFIANLFTKHIPTHLAKKTMLGRS